MTSRISRVAAFVSMVGLLATGCYRTPPGDVVVGMGEQVAPADGASTGNQTVTGSPTTGGAGVNGPTNQGPGANGSAQGQGETGTDVGQGPPAPGGAAPQEATGTDPGSNGPAPTTAPTAGPTTPPQPGTPVQHGQGVSPDGTVKIVYAYQQESCGGNNISDAVREKTLLVISEYVKWFNTEVLPPTGFQLEYEVVDDGGTKCPEKTQAAALKIVREIKPFAVLGGSVTQQRGPVLQDAVTRAGIIHFGQNFQTYAGLAAREPYARPSRGVSETGIRDMVDWIGVRVMGTQVASANAPGGGLAMEDRVYGVFGVENDDGRALTRVAADGLKAMGITPKGVYTISAEAGVAAQHAANLALRMRQDGVNTVAWAIPYESGIQSSIAVTEGMNSQGYYPEILIGSVGLAFFDQLHNSVVWARARGTSQLPLILLRTAIVGEEYEQVKDMVENADAYVKVWAKMGHSDNPQENAPASDVFQDTSQLVMGMLHLPGDALTPQTHAQGLDSTRRRQPNRCTTARFWGRDYAYTLTWDHGSGPTYGPKGFTTVYWVNEPNGPASGRYESYDNYRFFESANELEPQPTRDTGQEGYDVPNQEPIGLEPWSDCAQWGANFPDG